MWFVWISEQTEKFALYNFNGLVLYDWGGEGLLRGTYWVYKTDTFGL